MTNDHLESRYGSFYRRRDPEHVYPVEFVVRAFLGNYPRHRTDRASYAGKTALDLGFGDGRNMPLLHNLGMRVCGVEIAQDICDLATARMRRLGIDVDTRLGRNSNIPFPDQSFDTVLACHSCYYVDRGSTFEANLSEIARVLKPDGLFVFSAPMATSYIMAGARDLGEGHMEIAADPYGLRVGSILKKFDTEAEIAKALAPSFRDLAIGSCRNDWWGVEEHVWIVVCRRSS